MTDNKFITRVEIGEGKTMNEQKHDDELTLYTAQEVAGILRVSYMTVVAMLRQGKLKGFRVGREWRISEKELKNYLNNSMAESSKDTDDQKDDQ